MIAVVLLFSMFFIKHFICDYVLQFHYMVEQKGHYGARGGLEHAGIHALGTLAIFMLVFGWSGHNLFVALELALLDAVIHYHIDWAKMKLGRGLQPHDKKYWWFLGGDQMLHYMTYAFIIGLLVV
jgi:hypothetical protein